MAPPRSAVAESSLAIPSDLGDLSDLEDLWLDDNQLTGEIPSALGGLVNLQRLLLGNNQLTGCIPASLQDVADNDLDNLGLQDCATPLRASAQPTFSRKILGRPRG